MIGKFLKLLSALFFITGFFQAAQAQDTLPNFTASDKGRGNVVISWNNPFPNVAQVAVQRSYDSLRRFSTIYSAESPELPQNGFTDKVLPGLKVYYRIFYSLQGGAYFFSKSKRPGVDTNAVLTSETDLRRDKVTESIKEIVTKEPERTFYVKLGDSLIATLKDGFYIRFKDSIVARTKDTLLLMPHDTILLRRYDPPFQYHTSTYVYPNRDGYIVLDLPEALTKKYDVIITEEDNTPVLEIKSVKSTYLVLDKVNFYHGGWYRFELRENGTVKEKNKFFLSKDF